MLKFPTVPLYYLLHMSVNNITLHVALLATPHMVSVISLEARMIEHDRKLPCQGRFLASRKVIDMARCELHFTCV